MADPGEPLPTSAFDYELPQELIAQRPAAQREQSRLLVLQRASGAVRHRAFGELPELIGASDVLVLNETRVFPARLVGRKRTGGRAEALLLRPASAPAAEGPLWHALVRPGARLKPGASFEVGDELSVEIVAATSDGGRMVRLRTPLPLEQALERYGRIPLPPYIARDDSPEDRQRYQTVYARVSGSVAAPTAGLHFTPALLARIEASGARVARLVLHVGVGTFRPVDTEDPAEHAMHAEWYSVPQETAAAIASARAGGGAVWAVGTTVARALESRARDGGDVEPGQGWTDLFIRPPYRFRACDRLITNFHLPRSTLLMLVAAFGGYENVLRAYHEAIERRYRFYSYGDAMAIV